MEDSIHLRVLSTLGLDKSILSGQAENYGSPPATDLKDQHIGNFLNSKLNDKKRLQQELHSLAGGELAMLRLMLSMSPSDNESWEDRQAKCLKTLDTFVDKLRGLSLRIRSPLLDSFGLIPALSDVFEKFQARSGLQIDFRTADFDAKLNKVSETAAYCVVRQAVSNVVDHAHSERCTVSIASDQRYVTMSIQDYGVGFDVGACIVSNECHGVNEMTSTIELLGGNIRIESSIGIGTHVLAALPLV